MNPHNVNSYPFSGSSFPNSGSSCPSNGSSYLSTGSLGPYGGPPGQQIPTYHPTPAATSQPINIPWKEGTQHWSQPGLTGPEPPGGHYFNLPGGPGSYAPPPNAGGPGWIIHGQLGGWLFAPR